LTDISLDKIVLFDGVCNFCNSSVQFILKHDKTNSLKFTALQSPTGQALLKQYQVPANVDSVIFIENGQAYTKSAAALRIGRYFGGFWKGLQVFNIIPAVIRDLFYDLFARYRYRLFGKRDTCMLPSPEIRARFIDM
jgi:predicted DCC family thiol-disulfide oxidoreductase YuxK